MRTASRVGFLFCLAACAPLETASEDTGRSVANDSGGQLTGCPVRPGIDECTSGAIWAECGGSAADPVFACRRLDGRCYWFAAGCAALEFEASPCPAANVCCLGSPGYAFDASWRNPDVPSASVYGALYGWGTTPWDRTRERNVDVVIVPLADTGPSVSCSGGTLGVPCGDSASDLRITRSLHGALSVTLVTTRPSLGGWTLHLEVIRDEDASLHARACRVRFTDSVTFSCGPGQPECATAGTLEFQAFPADDAAAASTPLHVVASFADGTMIDAQL